MLQKIHDKVSGWVAYFFLGALAVVFIFWGIDFGFSTAGYAAKVKAEGLPWWRPAEKIEAEEVRRAWQNQLTQFQQYYRGELPPEMQEGMRNRLIEDFVRNRLLLQHTQDLGYRVSDAVVTKSFESIPAFQVDGKFSADAALYQLQQQGLTAAAFESQQRQYLQVAQLEQGLMQSAFVTPAELQTHRRLQNEQREASWLVIPATQFAGSVKVDEEAIKKHYADHQSAFMTPETVTLRYVQLKLDELAAAVEVSEDALRTYYEGAKDRFVDESGKPRTFEEARAEVEKEYRTHEAEKRFGDLQEQLADKAFESLKDIDAVAKDVGLKVQEIATFRRDIGGGNLGAPPEVIEAAFSEQVLNGENSRPIELAPDNIVVLRVSAHRPAEPKPLAEVRQTIVSAITKERSEQQARELAQRSAALMQAGSEDLQRLAKEFKTTPQGPKFVSRTDEAVPIEVRNALFATPRPVGEQPLYRPVTLGNGDAAILKFSAVRWDTAEEDPEHREARKNQMKEQIAQAELGMYLAELRREARVTTNSQIFE